MLFFVDNMLPSDLVYALRAAGHEARHTSRLARVKSGDSGIWAEACTRRATVLTKDKDFVAMATDHDNAKIILVRFGNLGSMPSIDKIIAALPEMIVQLDTTPLVYLD